MDRSFTTRLSALYKRHDSKSCLQDCSEPFVFVGDSYSGAEPRLLLVFLAPPATTEKTLKGLYQSSTDPPWPVVRRLTKEIFKDFMDPWEHLAVTSIFPCLPPKGKGTEQPDRQTLRSCLDLLFGQIGILKPTHVLIFGWTSLDHLGLSTIPTTILGDAEKIDMKQKATIGSSSKIPWVTTDVTPNWSNSDDKEILHIAITNPDMPIRQTDFSDHLYNWVQGSPATHKESRISKLVRAALGTEGHGVAATKAAQRD